jgi:hypothetical protein
MECDLNQEEEKVSFGRLFIFLCIIYSFTSFYFVDFSLFRVSLQVKSSLFNPIKSERLI